MKCCSKKDDLEKQIYLPMPVPIPNRPYAVNKLFLKFNIRYLIQFFYEGKHLYIN